MYVVKHIGKYKSMDGWPWKRATRTAAATFSALLVFVNPAVF